jgi:hypothetical protein
MAKPTILTIDDDLEVLQAIAYKSKKSWHNN